VWIFLLAWILVYFAFFRWRLPGEAQFPITMLFPLTLLAALTVEDLAAPCRMLGQESARQRLGHPPC